MTKEQFLARAPLFMGDILWTHLEILQKEDKEKENVKVEPATSQTPSTPSYPSSVSSTSYQQYQPYHHPHPDTQPSTTWRLKRLQSQPVFFAGWTSCWSQPGS